MDSLRYFATECHVDGFRFDLASALARELYDVDRLSAFFDVIHQDPVLSQVKLIAEPWDVGPGGYQVGNFPILWSEWNGMYRDTMRDFWRGHTAVAEFARRFTGSSDLYQSDGRHPSASINFVTCHDGFTLRDLVSYDRKHNDANREGNRDGTDDNRSWNCGVEGETDDPEVNELRDRQTRNFLATLLLSQGTPMLLAGDEIRRTQAGNNNAYCQTASCRGSTGGSTIGRRESAHEAAAAPPCRASGVPPVCVPDGEGPRGSGAPDVWWFRPDGRRTTLADWARGDAFALGAFLNGGEIPTQTQDGEPITDESFIVLFNAWREPVTFVLPPARFAAAGRTSSVRRSRTFRRTGRCPRRGGGAARGRASPGAAPRRVAREGSVDGRRGLLQHAQADLDDDGVEPRRPRRRAGGTPLHRERLAIGAVGRHRVERVAGEDDPGLSGISSPVRPSGSPARRSARGRRGRWGAPPRAGRSERESARRARGAARSSSAPRPSAARAS